MSDTSLPYRGGPADVATGPKGEVANAAFIGHSAQFAPALHRVSDAVFAAVGFGMSNSALVIAPDGLVVVDTGEGAAEARDHRDQFRTVTDAPVVAVIYSHFHYIYGTSVWQEECPGDLEIWGHAGIARNVVDVGAEVGPAFLRRLMMQFGAFLPAEGPDAMPRMGIGPFFFHPEGRRAEAGFVAPTHTVAEPSTHTIAGTEVHLHPAASDSDDTVVIQFPEFDTVVNNHVWPVLFNIYTLRGEPYRDPTVHIAAIDRIREMDPEHLVGVHGLPISGRAEVRRALADHRDSLQFIWDQTVRGINEGLGPDELAHWVVLPEALASSPYIPQHYGEVAFHARQIHMGLFGWFDADPATLHRVPPDEEGRRIVAGFGGAAAVETEIRRVLDADDFAWAAQLAGHLRAADPDSEAARTLQAEALRGIAQVTPAANTRGMALTAARALEGEADPMAATVWRPPAFRVMSAEPGRFIEALRVRLDPTAAAGIEQILIVDVTDRDHRCGLHVVHGVARYWTGEPPGDGLRLCLDLESLAQLLAGRAPLADLVAGGRAEVSPDVESIADFFDLFDHAGVR